MFRWLSSIQVTRLQSQLVYLKASQVEIITAMKVMSALTLIVSLPKHLSKIELDAVILKLGIDGAYEYAVLAVDGASMYGV